MMFQAQIGHRRGTNCNGRFDLLPKIERDLYEQAASQGAPRMRETTVSQCHSDVRRAPLRCIDCAPEQAAHLLSWCLFLPLSVLSKRLYNSDASERPIGRQYGAYLRERDRLAYQYKQKVIWQELKMSDIANFLKLVNLDSLVIVQIDTLPLRNCKGSRTMQPLDISYNLPSRCRA
jgi:hypothetical protein